MAFKHGKNQYFAITDSGAVERDISAFVTGVDMNVSMDLPETTTLGSSYRRRTVVGLGDGSFSLQTFHDTTANTGSWTVLKGLVGLATASTFKYGPEGSTGGLPLVTGTARLASLKTGAAVDGVVPITADFVTDSTVTFDTF